MGKKKTKQQRPNPLGLPELADTPKREPSGRAYRSQSDREPSIDPIKIRAIQMGKEITPAIIREMRAPWWGCKAGRAIATEIMEEAERVRLWDAICHMRRVQASFDAAIGAPYRHAKCLKLLLPVDELHADASTPAIDDRTPEEKQRSATTALMAVEGYLGWTDKGAASEAKRVVIEDTIVCDLRGLISALRCVSDGIAGKKMKYRGRD